jgi:hypothetical protein
VGVAVKVTVEPAQMALPVFADMLTLGVTAGVTVIEPEVVKGVQPPVSVTV